MLPCDILFRCECYLQNVVQKSQSQKKYDNKVASISAPYNISNNNKNLQESNKVPKIDQQLRLEFFSKKKTLRLE